MTERERWIVYPLLFLTMGISLRGKAYPTKKVDADRIECGELVVTGPDGKPAVVLNASAPGGQIIARRITCDELTVPGADGKPAVVLNASKSGGMVTAISADHALELTLGHFDRDSSLFVETPTSKGTAIWAPLGNLRRFAPQGLIQRLMQFPLVDPRLERSPIRIDKPQPEAKDQAD
jgi:hypothetical protein